jgi:outer membrane receptor protein involved in Fe transport
MKNVNFGIRYQMLNKNLTIAFVGEDIFATSYWLQTNKLNNTVEYSYDGHSYRISISYKFGNKNIKAKQVRSMEEIQRAANQ